MSTVPQFIEEIDERSFGSRRPPQIRAIEEIAANKAREKAERREQLRKRQASQPTPED